MAEGPDPYAGVMAQLLGPDAARIVAPAAHAGSAIRALRPAQVLFRPASRVTVTYRATLEWTDGRRVDEMIVATADRDGLPPAAATSSAGEEPVAVWRAPRDPLLPGMERALDTSFALRLLTDAGVRARTARVTLRAYRPGRRAVVEVWPVEPESRKLVFTRGAGTLRAASSTQEEPAFYLKVLRPDHAVEVAAVHEQLLPHVPAPPCEIAGGPGILRLGLLRGASLGACLRRGRPRTPSPDELLDLLDRLDDAALPGAPDSGSDAPLRRYVRLLRALVPEEAERLERLSDALSGAERQPIVTVHGDFHEGNILVGDQGISGLLDVDDVGPGERVEDLGLLIGRIWSLAHGRAGEPALRYARDLLRRSDAVVDPGELRRRIGVALVGRATAPFRNQLEGWRAQTSGRLELAERWVRSVAAASR
jgi:phosphotransferase family enzyme